MLIYRLLIYKVVLYSILIHNNTIFAVIKEFQLQPVGLIADYYLTPPNSSQDTTEITLSCVTGRSAPTPLVHWTLSPIGENSAQSSPFTGGKQMVSEFGSTKILTLIGLLMN